MKNLLLIIIALVLVSGSAFSAPSGGLGNLKISHGWAVWDIVTANLDKSPGQVLKIIKAVDSLDSQSAAVGYKISKILRGESSDKQYKAKKLATRVGFAADYMQSQCARRGHHSVKSLSETIGKGKNIDVQRKHQEANSNNDHGNSLAGAALREHHGNGAAAVSKNPQGNGKKVRHYLTKKMLLDDAKQKGLI